MIPSALNAFHLIAVLSMKTWECLLAAGCAHSAMNAAVVVDLSSVVLFFPAENNI